MPHSSIPASLLLATALCLSGCDKETQPSAPKEPAKSTAPAANQPATQPATQQPAAKTATSPTTAKTAPADDSANRLGSKEPIAKPAGAIRLAVYNIENLFDARADGKSKVTDEKPKEHCAAAAEAIRKVNADVLALVEIESKEALTEFRDLYLKDLGYTYISSLDAGDGRGIEQSVLSRFPLSQEKNWLHAKLEGVHHVDNSAERIKAGTPLDLKRSPLHVVVTVPADKTGGKPYELTLFVMHHKAGREFGYWRTAEAQFISKLVSEELKADKDRQIAVVGDFNAQPTDESFQTYITGGLIDVFADRKKEPKWFTHMSGRSIDNIFMTPSLSADVVTETRFILGTPVKAAKGDWDTMPYPAGYASDHLPVVVDLRVK